MSPVRRLLARLRQRYAKPQPFKLNVADVSPEAAEAFAAEFRRYMQRGQGRLR